MWRTIVATLLLTAAVAQAGDTARVRFLWPTRMTTDTVGTTWIVVIEPHRDNRHAYLTAYDGELVVTSSYRALAGEQAARTWRVEWRTPLPAGELMMVASIQDGQQKELARATVPVTVHQMRP